MSDFLNPGSQFYKQGYSDASGEIFKGGEPRKIKFTDIEELLAEIERRAKNGHVTRQCDDPKQLIVGVFDETANQWLRIMIRDLHKSKALMSEERRCFLSECFNTKEGKEVLFRRN